MTIISEYYKSEYDGRTYCFSHFRDYKRTIFIGRLREVHDFPRKYETGVVESFAVLQERAILARSLTILADSGDSFDLPVDAVQEFVGKALRDRLKDELDSISGREVWKKYQHFARIDRPDGQPDHVDVTVHGRSGYDRGCRCDRCRRAKSSAMRRLLADRMNQRILIDGRYVWVGSTVPHGDYSTYNNYGCRCEPCTDAKRKRTRNGKTTST